LIVLFVDFEKTSALIQRSEHDPNMIRPDIPRAFWSSSLVAYIISYIRKNIRQKPIWWRHNVAQNPSEIPNLAPDLAPVR
jgi:hypothetical protein